MMSSKKLNFVPLRKVMDQIDDNGKSGRCGNWQMGLGGYDHGYEIYYRGTPICRVNYGDKEYELYVDDFITRETLPEFLDAIDARGFKNVHEKDTGTYKEGDLVSWHDQEWYIDDGWYDEDEKQYFYTIMQLNGHKMDAVPEEELTPLDDDESSSSAVNESMSLKDITKRYSARQRTALDGKSWWVAFDNETGKYIPGSRKYKTKGECETGIIIDMKHGRLDATTDELDSLEVAFGGMRTESTRKQKMKFGKFVKESIDNLESFLSKKEKEFKPSRVNPSWDDSEDKIWAVQDYISMMGGFTDEDREFLSETDPELLSLEDDVDMMHESTRKNKMKFKKIVKENTEFPFMANGRNFLKLINDLGDENVVGVKNVRGDDNTSFILFDDDYSIKDAKEFAELLEQRYDNISVQVKMGRNYGNSTPMVVVNKIKMLNESDEGKNYDSDTPKIYVGTYAKYNDGSIDGKWIDLTEYDTYEDFVAACRELHKDEKDPEFMVQDYENFPEKWYHEGGLPTEEEFNKINEYYMMGDDRKEAYEAYVNYTGDDDFDNFQEAYQGHFDSPTDFAYDIVDNLGWEGVGQENIDMYFDYDSFGRDLMYDFHQGDPDNQDSEGNPEDPDHYYDNDGYDQGEYESDRQVAEDYVDSLGGIDQLGDNAQNYFDYEAFGRDLLINDYFEEDGYIFRRY